MEKPNIEPEISPQQHELIVDASIEIAKFAVAKLCDLGEERSLDVFNGMVFWALGDAIARIAFYGGAQDTVDDIAFNGKPSES